MIRGLLHLAGSGFRFLKENDGRTVMSATLSRDAHPLVQFVKYGFCGVLAVICHNAIVYLLGLTVIPAVGADIPRELKETNTMINNSIAFVFSAVVAYLLNVKFVFTPGRHEKHKEIALFVLISAVSFFAGLFSIPAIFRLLKFDANIEHFANLGFIFTSALVNFICRKFIVFKN